MEFKVFLHILLQHCGKGINRIRLEFKVKTTNWNKEGDNRINRIRLEFKANNQLKVKVFILVLIESDWNLKKESEARVKRLNPY